MAPSYGMAKCLKLAGPIVRRGTSFHADQTRRQLLKEHQDGASLQLAAYNNLAGAAISKPIVVIVCMARSSKSWEPLIAPISMALAEEPSTASRPELRRQTALSMKLVEQGLGL